jgi:hypothetical protein
VPPEKFMGARARVPSTTLAWSCYRFDLGETEVDMVQRITAALLNDRFGGPSERFYKARLPELLRLGLVAKHGKSFFGDVEEIAAWLAGRAVKAKPPRIIPLRPPGTVGGGQGDGAA